MRDDIVTILRDWGTSVARILDDENTPSKMLHEAADEIERLRTALALACGELSGYGPHTNSSPDHLMQELLEEADRG